MKQGYTLLIILSISANLFSQLPERMNYQAVVRNSNNDLIRNQPIGIRVSIIRGSPYGTVVYRETYDPNPVSNANGLITLEIGGGIQSIGKFEEIDWSAGPYFIMTETDPAGGTNYTITGTSQFLSVPYALFAKKTANAATKMQMDSMHKAIKDYVENIEHRLENLVYNKLPVTTNGIIGYYPFNGDANDESGNGYNGSVKGASLTRDRFGIADRAYRFNSANKNHITINSAIGNFGISNFTISVWVKRTSSAGNEIFTQRSTPFRNSSWWELGWGTFSINENIAYESKVNINADDTLRNDVWYHFTGVREARTIKFYLNGKLRGENSTVQILNIDNNSKSEIGCLFYDVPLQCFNGIIDDIRLYNRALSEDEIRQIYNEGGFPGTLIGDEDDNTYRWVEWKGKVMTVHGLIPADSLGITLPHEHLLIVHNFNSNDLTSEADAISELKRYADAGGKSLVEVTNIGIGRNPPALKRIAAATGVNVISGTGCYKDRWVHDSIKNKSVAQLTEIMVKDITHGINGIHCGIIGEIGLSRPITAFEKKLLVASARAHKVTGAAIYLHFDRQVEASDRHYVLDILEKEGADLTQVVVGHNIPYVELVNDFISYANRGCFVSFDMIGLEVLLYFGKKQKLFETLKAIVDRGYIKNLLISQDVCFSQCLVKNGGYGYDNLLKNYVPDFISRGLTREQINTIMIDNPKRMLALR